MGQAQKSETYTAQDYWDLPEGMRAELIDGQLWDLASPGRVHQEIVLKLSRMLDTYIDDHNGLCKVYPAPFAVDLFADSSTMVEPDISVICDREKLTDRGCTGAPDFIIEVVSPSNPGMDYVTKLNLYHDAGVREYWICDPQNKRVHVYAFETDPTPSVYGFDQPVASEVFPGFSVLFETIVANM